MAINLNLTTVNNVKFNNQQLSKVNFNGTTVWENIKHMTGQLYWPTSNTSLEPNFTITDWSDGAFDGDGSDKAWKLFGEGHYAKMAHVNGQRCGAQITFNMDAEIYPIKIDYDGGNHDAGSGGGGGNQVVEARRPDGTWYEIGRHNDIGGGTITMDGKTRITGLRMGSIFGAGPKKYVVAASCQVKEWNQKGSF